MSARASCVLFIFKVINLCSETSPAVNCVYYLGGHVYIVIEHFALYNTTIPGQMLLK